VTSNPSSTQVVPGVVKGIAHLPSDTVVGAEIVPLDETGSHQFNPASTILARCYPNLPEDTRLNAAYQTSFLLPSQNSG
jgi:hypothetical protein